MCFLQKGSGSDALPRELRLTKLNVLSNVDPFLLLWFWLV